MSKPKTYLTPKQFNILLDSIMSREIFDAILNKDSKLIEMKKQTKILNNIYIEIQEIKRSLKKNE